MTWNEYITDHMSTLLLHLSGMTALTVFLLATGTEPGTLMIILLAWLIGDSLFGIAGFLRLRTHLRELESIMDSLDQKHLFVECAPKPVGTYERHLFLLLHRSSRAMVGAVSDAQASQRAYREYVESWVHEIKTPITASQLICRNIDTNIRRKLLPELAQIENHVERALFYARAESLERDFVIRKVNLANIVSQAVEHHRALLMQNGVCMEIDGLDFMVYTDEKWTVFLLGQLLQNAIRYRREKPIIQLFGRALGHQIQLSVTDNGIGIPAYELPRVFDRGFTGSNGRTRGGATGMGLYLCKRLGDFLQIDLTVSSVKSEGTSVVLTFPAPENLSKL